MSKKQRFDNPLRPFDDQLPNNNPTADRVKLQRRAHLLQTFQMLAIERIKIKGLEEINGLERIGIYNQYWQHLLFEQGQFLFINDPKLGYLITPVNLEDPTLMNEYKTRRAHDLNFDEVFNIDDSVVVKNNFFSTPTRHLIANEIDQLVELDHTIKKRTQMNGLQFVVTTTGGETKFNQQQFLNSVIDSDIVPIINLKPNQNINILDVKPEYINDKLLLEYSTIENKILTILGLDNVNIQKKERLITAEAEQNNDQINHYFKMYVSAQQEGLNRINKMFGLNLSIEVEDKEETTQEQPTIEGGSDVNGE